MRLEAAIVLARAASATSRSFRIGGGTALPGLIAERVDPVLVQELSARLGAGSILVTGTNGKTTTARLIRSIAVAAGLKPVANREGSNMMRGIAAALAEGAKWDGHFTEAKRRIGIFEVDEATLPLACDAVRPRAVLFTNLFRDQLDRYGEVETVAKLWEDTVSRLPADTGLVLNADDPSVAHLADVARGEVLFFGLSIPGEPGRQPDHAADARWCRRCGHELAHSAMYYGHIGHWSCPGCGNERPTPAVCCSRLVSGVESAEMTIQAPTGSVEIKAPLTGLYNAYNVAAAGAMATALGWGLEATGAALSKSTAAFGRQERIALGDKFAEVLLAKNPAGLNQVLATVTGRGEDGHYVFFLNDRIADGRDISWIWDVDFELLAGKANAITVSGDRAWDLALRIKYAGLGNMPVVEANAADALKSALQSVPAGATLYVIPTYTAMLEVRNLLGKWSGKGAFWQGGGS
jgi:UDP-N-acetylmuramyl tripeptide synthase